MIFFFLCRPFFKVFIEFVTILLMFFFFNVLVFCLQGMCDLSSPTRNEPTSPSLEDKVLTTGPPGKSSKGGFLTLPILEWLDKSI